MVGVNAVFIRKHTRDTHLTRYIVQLVILTGKPPEYEAKLPWAAKNDLVT